MYIIFASTFKSKLRDDNMSKLQIIIDNKTAEQIVELAKKEGRSISNFLRKMILENLGERNDI